MGRLQVSRRVRILRKSGLPGADYSMEAISYYAIKASTDLAEERGSYPSFKGSLWSQGILPIDGVAPISAKRSP